jgi:hypothetical protein
MNNLHTPMNNERTIALIFTNSVIFIFEINDLKLK